MVSIISTDKAPAAIGPYCQATAHNGILYVSGCIGLNEKTMTLQGGLESQTEKSLNNLSEILISGGSRLDKVLKVTVYLTDMADFAKCNAVYSKFFTTHKPARACVAVKQLPKGALFEIDATAVITQSKL